MPNSNVDLIGDPSRYILCEHSEIEVYYLRLIEVVVFQHIFGRSVWSHHNIIDVEPFCEFSEGSFLAVTPEDQVIVAFSGLHDLLKGVEVVVFFVEFEKIIVPINNCFS